MQSFKLLIQVILRSLNRFILISLALSGLSISSAHAVTTLLYGPVDVAGLDRIGTLTALAITFDGQLPTSIPADIAAEITEIRLFGTTDVVLSTDLAGGLQLDPDSELFIDTLGRFYLGNPGLGIHWIDAPVAQDDRFFHPDDAVWVFFVRNGIATSDGIGLSTPDVGVFAVDWGTPTVSVIPVPAAVWLFGTALLGLIGFSKRRKAA